MYPQPPSPHGRQNIREYGQCEGGTHPTGMHPCSYMLELLGLRFAKRELKRLLLLTVK